MRKPKILGVEDKSLTGRLERLFTSMYHRARTEIVHNSTMLNRYAVQIPRHMFYSRFRRPDPDIMEVKLPGDAMSHLKKDGATKHVINLPLLYGSSISVVPDHVTKLEDAIAHIDELRNKRAAPFKTLVIAGHGTDGLMSTTLRAEEAFTIKELLDQLFANGKKPAEHIVLAACDVFSSIHFRGRDEQQDLCAVVSEAAMKHNVRISGATSLLFHQKGRFITFNPDGSVTRSPFSSKSRLYGVLAIESASLSGALNVQEPPKRTRTWVAPWRKDRTLSS
ncbi:MAG: hypothetical protein SFW65_07985 [Alphaproteobacteria bacterium]|nr:hypothetical protein [Alphaproteobacteria bacterium]